MPSPLILESLALAAVIVSAVVVCRSSAERPQLRIRALTPLLLSGLLLAGAIGLNATRQSRGAGPSAERGTSARTDLQLRVQEWLDRHEKEPPDPKEVGRNMRIVREGLAFLRPYQSRLPEHLRLQAAEASRLPSHATRILSHSEEQQYFQAAQAVFESVRTLARGD